MLTDSCRLIQKKNPDKIARTGLMVLYQMMLQLMNSTKETVAEDFAPGQEWWGGSHQIIVWLLG